MSNSCHNIHSNFKLNGFLYRKFVNNSSYKEFLSDKRELLDFIESWTNNSLVISLQTSGSTSIPKKILAEKSAMACSAKKTGKQFNLKPGDKALLCLPLTFIAGKMMIVRALVLGLDLYITKPSRSPLKNFSKSFDFAAMTPYQLEKSIEYLNKVKCLIIGGSPVGEVIKKKIKNKTSGVYETYGMTETLSHVAIKNLSLGENEFVALPGITFSKNNGFLEINAPFLSKSPIITNDLIHLVSKTAFEWQGRASLTINSGGIKLNPEKIEKTLSKHYNVPFIICGLPDEQLGEKIVLVFENKIPSMPELVFKKLNSFERPKGIFSLNSFSRRHGKINRKDIQNRLLKKLHDRN